MSQPFPEAFAKRVKEDPFLGEKLLDDLNGIAPVSIRFNPSKNHSELDVLKKVDWCEYAFYLQERPIFTLDPLFHAGCYYPQEAGSMLLDTVLNKLNLPDDPIILDLCAAPGGKSTLIATFLKNRGLLVSNEVIRSRSSILRENMVKWGYTNTVVTNNDPRDFKRLESVFDVITVDAPCSGEGMFRKDPASRNEWTEDNVALCAGRQRRILSDCWDSLKSGGYLVYSTCTFNEEENEKNVRWICAAYDAEIVKMEMPVEIREGRGGIGHYSIPGESMTEGFYIAVLQKRSGDSKKRKRNINLNCKEFKGEVSLDDILNTEDITLFSWNDNLIAFPKGTEDIMLALQAQMSIRKIGTFVGEQTRKGLIPSEELVLNPFLVRLNNQISLDKEYALKYLHGDTFPLNGSAGFLAMTYNGVALGWIKHLGNRFNNLYPKEWRIRMDLNKLM